MGVFFSDWCSPGQVVVDPRENIRLSWFYYQDPNNPDNEDPLQYFKVLWKPATVKGWTDPLVKSTILDTTATHFDLPAGTWTLDAVWAWRVEAWVIDRDYDPDVPPSAGGPTGDPFVQSENSMVVDTSGYTIWSERNGVVSSGNQGFATTSQRYNIWTLIPSDPGDYEVRFRVSNGFQWSAYSTPVIMKQYDTARWIKKNGIWWAVPDWRKNAGTMQLVRK